MQVIGIMAHTERPAALELAQSAFDIIAGEGAIPVLEEGTAHTLGMPCHWKDHRVEGMLVIGGDGCILRGAAIAARHDIPMLGVNLGRIGFLSEVDPSELHQSVCRLIADDYEIENRMMLRGEMSGTKKDSWLALNDFTISKNNVARLTEIEVAINGQVVDRYRCDGVVIATPTGSTAYSMSAGGPIMLPSANGIIVTPICPHKIGPRPMVMAADAEVSIQTFGINGHCSVSSDGRPDCMDFCPQDLLIVRKARELTKLVHMKEYRFFDLLKQKLY